MSQRFQDLGLYKKKRSGQNLRKSHCFKSKSGINVISSKQLIMGLYGWMGRTARDNSRVGWMW